MDTYGSHLKSPWTKGSCNSKLTKKKMKDVTTLHQLRDVLAVGSDSQPTDNFTFASFGCKVWIWLRVEPCLNKYISMVAILNQLTLANWNDGDSQPVFFPVTRSLRATMIIQSIIKFVQSLNQPETQLQVSSDFWRVDFLKVGFEFVEASKTLNQRNS